MTCKELSDILLRTPNKEVFIHEYLEDSITSIVQVYERKVSVYRNYTKNISDRVDGVVIE